MVFEEENVRIVSHKRKSPLIRRGSEWIKKTVFKMVFL